MTGKQRLAVLGVIGAVLVVDRVLLALETKGSARPPPRPAAASPPRSGRVESPRFSSTGGPPSLPSASPVGEDPPRLAPPVSDRAMGRDPEGAKAVLALVGHPHGTPAEKVQLIRDTIANTGICTAEACMKTKASLEAVAAMPDIAVRASECYQAACLVEISGQSGSIERALTEAQRAGKLDWPVPAMFTRPIVDSRGGQSAMWVFFNPE